MSKIGLLENDISDSLNFFEKLIFLFIEIFFVQNTFFRKINIKIC
jgi:hypothetical protein